MNDTETERRAAEIFALRSIRDTAVIFAIGSGVSRTEDTARFFEKVGEHTVAVPLPRARELVRLTLEDGGDGLAEFGHTVHSARTIAFDFRNVMLTTAGNAVLRAAGA